MPTTSEDENQVQTNNKEITCRICAGREFQLDKNDKRQMRLVAPCECQGHFAFVHEACMNDWLEKTGNEHCDICRYKLKFDKKAKNFFDYIKDEESHHVVTRFVCGILFNCCFVFTLLEYSIFFVSFIPFLKNLLELNFNFTISTLF